MSAFFKRKFSGDKETEQKAAEKLKDKLENPFEPAKEVSKKNPLPEREKPEDEFNKYIHPNEDSFSKRPARNSKKKKQDEVPDKTRIAMSRPSVPVGVMEKSSSEEQILSLHDQLRSSREASPTLFNMPEETFSEQSEPQYYYPKRYSYSPRLRSRYYGDYQGPVRERQLYEKLRTSHPSPTGLKYKKTPTYSSPKRSTKGYRSPYRQKTAYSPKHTNYIQPDEWKKYEKSPDRYYDPPSPKMKNYGTIDPLMYQQKTGSPKNSKPLTTYVPYKYFEPQYTRPNFGSYSNHEQLRMEEMRRLRYLRHSIKEQKPKPFVFDPTPKHPHQKKKLELVVTVNLAKKGPKDIHVHEDDEAFDLAQEFAKKYHITGKQKQHDLLNMLQKKIHDHRKNKYKKEPEQDESTMTNIQISPASDRKQKQFSNRQKLDPDVKREVETAFKDIWLDYNPKTGTAKFHKYMTVMKHFKQYKKIKDRPTGPFSDKELEKEWAYELKTAYGDEQLYDDMIPHKDVFYIAHDQLIKLRQYNAERAAYRRYIEQEQRRRASYYRDPWYMKTNGYYHRPSDYHYGRLYH